MPTCKTFILLIPLLCLTAAGHALDSGQDRPPAVAGTFYPGQADELKQMLADLFAKAVPRKDQGEVAAIVVPHAGYEYSGEVAASGFNQLDPDKAYDNVFILGPSHRVGFEGAAVYCAGDFITPLGTVPVNRELGLELIKKSPLFSARTDAHSLEHSVEVVVPFVQHHLKRPFRIVPIVLGANSPATCLQVGEALRPFMSEKNLFVVSTDFSHYPAYDDAVMVDKAVAEAIVANAPESLIETMQRYENAAIKNLGTTLCGASGVLTLAYMTSAAKGLVYHPIQYKNSGDRLLADKRRVVGYHAITVSRPGKAVDKEAAFELSAKDKEVLLGIARRAVVSLVTRQAAPEVETSVLSSALRTPSGAFVTLKKHGELRGCIGQFEAIGALHKVVREMAIAAATRDSRFTPVTEGELRDLTVEISVLTPMRRINSIDALELGRHGIYIKKGWRAGTFLPQVAQETGWSKEEFLGHCARDKAGLGWEGWKEAELYVYEALVFGEH